MQALAVGDEKIGTIRSKPMHIVESGKVDKHGFPIFDTNECFAKYQTQYEKSKNINNNDNGGESVEDDTQQIDNFYQNLGRWRLGYRDTFDETDRDCKMHKHNVINNNSNINGDIDINTNSSDNNEKSSMSTSISMATTFDWTHDLGYQMVTPYYENSNENNGEEEEKQDRLGWIKGETVTSRDLAMNTIVFNNDFDKERQEWQIGDRAKIWRRNPLNGKSGAQVLLTHDTPIGWQVIDSSSSIHSIYMIKRVMVTTTTTTLVCLHGYVHIVVLCVLVMMENTKYFNII